MGIPGTRAARHGLLRFEDTIAGLPAMPSRTISLGESMTVEQIEDRLTTIKTLIDTICEQDDPGPSETDATYDLMAEREELTAQLKALKE